MAHFCQYEEAFGDRGLDLRYFFAEILKKRFLQLSSGLSRLLADDAEAFVEFLENLLRDECTYGAAVSTRLFQGLSQCR